MSTPAPDGARSSSWMRRNVRWQVLALLCLVSIVAYLFRQNVSIAGVAIRNELGLSDVQLGWVLSSFIWGYALFQLPGGIFGQVVGPRRALTIIVIAWTGLTILCGVLPGTLLRSATSILLGLVALRFVMGAVQAPLFPIVGGTVAAWFPASRWAFPNALSSSALNVGSAMTGPLVAWFLVAFGWRPSFYLLAPFGILTAALWWWLARDDPSQHPKVEPEERALIAGDRPPQAESLPHGAWGRLLANPDVLLISTSYLCMNIVFYIFFSWLFVYLVDVRGFDVLEGGFLSALPWMVGSVGAAAGGEVCDRLCRRIGPRWGCRIPAITGLVLAAVLLMAGALAPNPYVAIALLSLCLAANQFTEGAYWEGTTFVSSRYASAACGVLNTGGNLGGIVATPMIPYLKDELGWLVALGSGSAFALLGAGLWLFVRADRPMVEPARPS